MTYRQFIVYLRGFSPDSTTVAKLQSSRQMGRSGKKVNVVEGTKAAQHAFEALFKTPSKAG